MSNVERPKLRVALLLNSFVQPAWVARIIREIHESCFAEISLVVKIDVEQKMSTRPSNDPRIGNMPTLWKAYSVMDNLTVHPYADPYELCNVSNALSTSPVITVLATRQEQDYPLSNAEISRIKSLSIDVALDLAKERICGPALEMAKHGVWTFEPSSFPKNGDAPQGFWELMTGTTTTESTLRAMGPEPDQEKILYRSSTAVDLYSMKGTRSKVCWKTAHAVTRCLRRLYQADPSLLETENSAWAQKGHTASATNPTNWDVARFITKIVQRRAAHKIRGYFQKERWFLAYKLGAPAFPSNTTPGFTFMIPPKDRFWADPFPVERNGKYYIFIEEFMYASMKGHISVIEMEAVGTWKTPVKVLDTNYHLSYPFIFEWEGNLFMIPESKGNRTIELYRCAEFPAKWELERVLMKDIQAVDSTLFEAEGKWWLFCNIGGKEFASNDELHLFFADRPMGPWKPHKNNPIKTDVKSARPAGKLFYWDGQLYRPSQDCSARMGSAMTINRVRTLTPDCYHEEEVTRIEPVWTKGLHGTHTFNASESLTVIDCFDYILTLF
jgi:hypothetical protein